MDIEDLIRSTQARQAERAVPADRIRSELPKRVARARRRRRFGVLGAAAAAAAVATAIAVPALTLPRDGAGNDPVVAAAPSPGTGQPRSFRLGYRPAWVPPGFAERIRYADLEDPADGFGPTVLRVWKKQVGRGDPWGGTELTLYVRTAVADPGTAMDTSGQKVDINGVRGYYTPAHDEKNSSVNWSLDAHTVLMLTADHLDIAQPDLLRMARSVRPDPGLVTVPVRLRWLPAGWRTTNVTVSGPSAATWRGEVAAAKPAPEPTTSADRRKRKDAATNPVGSLTVEVGDTTAAPDGGTTGTVGGRPARYPVRTDVPGQSLRYLVVDLGGGRMLTLIGDGGGITVDDLTRIAEQVDITPTGLDWLGG
jgi:hypothetical protein